MYGNKGTTIGCWLVWCYVFLTYHAVSEAPADTNGMTRSPFQRPKCRRINPVSVSRRRSIQGRSSAKRSISLSVSCETRDKSRRSVRTIETWTHACPSFLFYIFLSSCFLCTAYNLGSSRRLCIRSKKEEQIFVFYLNARIVVFSSFNSGSMRTMLSREPTVSHALQVKRKIKCKI